MWKMFWSWNYFVVTAAWKDTHHLLRVRNPESVSSPASHDYFMNNLDCIKRDSSKWLIYWKERIEKERALEINRRSEIKITPDTLAWFLWMIENRSTVVISKRPWWKIWGHD